MTPAASVKTSSAALAAPEAVPTTPPVVEPRKSSGRFWALSDQILVSGTNFIMMVMTARALHPAEFGTFTQAYAILLLANIFQFALVVQAHQVIGSTRAGASYAAYTTATAISQLGLSVLQGLIIAAVATIGSAAGWSWAGLAWALVPAVCAWQLQEFVRRVLYTEGRNAAAFFNDCVAYGGQAIVIFWLWHRGTLHDTTALYVLAATSFVGALLGIWQIRGSLTRKFDRAAIAENWQFGRWLLGGELLQYASSIQTYLFIAAALLGASAAGELRAAQIVFGPTRVFSFYLGNVLPIRFSRALAGEGSKSTMAIFYSVLRQVVPPFAIYSVTIAIFAQPILHLMYGADFAGQPWVLRTYAGVALLSYILVVIVSLLSAQRKTHAIFIGQLAGALVGLGIGWLAILLLGVAGAPLAIGVSTLVTMMYLYSRAQGGSADASAVTAPSGDVDKAIEAMEAPSEMMARRSQLLIEIARDLNDAQIRYCVSHGHAALPERIVSDVDCIIDASTDTATLDRVLRGAMTSGSSPTRRIVQWLSDGADYIVIADLDARAPAMVALHLTSDYDLDGYRVFTGSEILASRTQRGELWVTQPAMEAGCIIANRVMKQDLRPRDQQRLMELYATDAAACESMTRRLLGDVAANTIRAGATSGDWSPVLEQMVSINRALRMNLPPGALMGMFARRTADTLRRLRRWASPRNGFHVVFLGPDGVGKSTVIEEVRDAVRPAFLNYSYQTFAPSLLPAKFTEKPSPHARPPRSLPASLMKAAWWTFCYGPLYFYAVRPTLARAGLVINHRYLLDAIVDTKRYRYSGPTWLLKAIWFISPKPDLVILLDAPADVIQARKKEMPFEETARQCAAYRKLIDPLPNGVRVDANRPLDEVVASANTAILSRLEKRFARR